ncbi:MAG: DUF2783 domain-containing protein [Geminicoccaceae bacterium]
MTGRDGTLKRDPNFEDPDGFYAAYIAAHAGLSDAESELFNARLVLILANQIGDRSVLLEALDLARSSLAAEANASASGPHPA